MLPLLEQEEPAVVRSLRRRAAQYYSRQGLATAKVEELYYRLALGQSSRTFDRVLR